jgi:putative ABC transport system permease protein
MGNLLQDIRYALRTLAKTPAFTLTVVLVLALGIGANSTIFSVVNGVLLRPLPYPEPGRLVMIWEDYQRVGGPAREWTNPADFNDWRTMSASFAEMFAANDWSPTLTGEGEPELLNAAVATQGMFATLGVQPALGRGFREEEDKPGAARVVLLSDGLWKRRFGGRPEAIGRVLMLSGNAATIIGVMPAGFRFPVVSNAEIWSPMQAAPTSGRGGAFVRVVGRLKPGVELASAQAEMDTIAARIARANPETNNKIGVTLVGLQTDMARPVREALLVLLGAVGFVLLIACANVANLLLARATARQREIAIRVALGASRARLARQLLTESLLLSGAGAALGLTLAWWGADWLAAGDPAGLAQSFDLRVDYSVAAFALVLALGTGLLFGLAPAMQAVRTGPNEALQEGARGSSGRSNRVRSALVVAEVALSLVLLVGAGLLLKSFASLLRTSPGFNPQNVLTVSLTLPQVKYPEAAQSAQFYSRLLERVRAMPGVRAVAAINNLPLGGTNSDTNFVIEGRPAPRQGEMQGAWFSPVTTGYFQAMNIPVLQGRPLDERDHSQAPLAVVINEAMARRYWPGESPIGKRIGTGRRSPTAPTWWQVVGVVGNVRAFTMESDEPPTFYIAHAQRPARRMNLVIRTAGDPLALAPALRSAVWELDRDLAVPSIATLDAVVGSSLAQRRFIMVLLAGFSAVALVMAAVGLYGVMAYIVTQRTNEIGIRMALGAQPRDVLALVLRQGMTLAGLGVAIGVALALAVARSMESLVYDTSPRDPATIAAITATLALAALAACYIPARRAARVDPLVALRHE